ncbi:homocysteine S-methyltransferase family protein [Aestuariibius sp. 2305UL40-4]|uniref:homocysteine S-methyltransferase family protein n=1 Tax=Aestuariibius violaceus TaxID=3234132 RepID=UPI003489254E
MELQEKGPVAALKNARRPWLTDGGLETAMIFDEGFVLPAFAAFTLIDDRKGREALRRYYARFLDIARRAGTGFVLDTPTWRASTIWGGALGLTARQVADVNRRCAAFVREIAESEAAAGVPVIVNGVIGPLGDGYVAEQTRSARKAEAVHKAQISALAEAGVDTISGVTMTHVEEAIGLARAGQGMHLPTVISFTVETDGRLPSGQSLEDAIGMTEAATGGSVLHYMINCAHPDHFLPVLRQGGGWRQRIGGLRVNASRMSHAELDAADDLDAGNPAELGAAHAELLTLLPNVRVIGGCCGTDHRHVACMAETVCYAA